MHLKKEKKKKFFAMPYLSHFHKAAWRMLHCCEKDRVASKRRKQHTVKAFYAGTSGNHQGKESKPIVSFSKMFSRSIQKCLQMTVA